jgi:hypothetical protein
MALQDKGRLLTELKRVPVTRFGIEAVNGFVDQIEREIDAVSVTNIASTGNILQGDGTGGASDSGIAASDVVIKSSGPTPSTLGEVIAILQAAGLCSMFVFFFGNGI